MYTTIPVAILSLLPLAFTKNIPITVGPNAQLAFYPSNIEAAVGDTLTFSYFPNNHSVGQSSFAEPCQPLEGGFFSGFQPLSAGPGPVDFVVTVNDTKPIWVYCAQTTGRHCQTGMSMVVNQPAPPSPNTLEAYKRAAAKAGNSTAPPYIAGGVFVAKNSSSHSSAVTATVSGGGPYTYGYNDGSGYGSFNGDSSSATTTLGNPLSPPGAPSAGSGTGSASPSSTSPIAFPGVGNKVSSGLSVLVAAAGAVGFALF